MFLLHLIQTEVIHEVPFSWDLDEGWTIHGDLSSARVSLHVAPHYFIASPEFLSNKEVDFQVKAFQEDKL